MGRITRARRPGSVPRALAAGGPAAASTPWLLTLQEQAGNRAVQRLVRSLQRSPLGKDDDPHGYTGTAGVADVAGSGTTRVEVHGLKYGLKSGFQSSYTTKRGRSVSDEANKTKESPDHMAVVVLPDKVPAGRSVQVILHFHGFGFRGGDPYAGYMVAAGDKNVGKGTVRDVDQEHWEQQIGAVNKGRTKSQPFVVAVLAQGRGPEDFGDLPTFDYVHDVLGKVDALKGVSDYQLVLSAHSGGGFTVANRVASGQAKTSDRKQLPAAQKGKAPPQSTDLVVLFDAEAVGSVAGSAIDRIDTLAKKLTTADEAQARAAIAATPKFRFYFAVGGAYQSAYIEQWRLVQQAIDRVPAVWARGGNEVTVDDLVRFVPVTGKGVNHEHVISGATDKAAEQGSLADALRASVSPKIDRGQAYVPKATAPAKTKGTPKKKAKGTVKGAATPTTAPVTPTRSAGSTTASGARMSPTPTRSSTAVGATAAKPAAGWRAAGMVADYTFTEKHKKTLESQTAEERAEDRKAFDKAAKSKLTALAKKEKKNTITEAEKGELVTLRQLAERVAAAESANKHKDVEEVLTAAGTTVDAWYGALQTGSFLGQAAHVHPALADRLRRAEAALVADPTVNPKQLDAAGLGKALLYSVADMRVPKAATGGTSLSMHVFGLAVDLNYRGNPFVGNASKGVYAVVKRATSLVDGTPIDIGTHLGKAGKAFDTLSSASHALRTYLAVTGANDPTLVALAGKHTAQGKEPKDAAGWFAQIEKDRKSLTGGDFAEHTPASQGFMDLDKALVLAMADAGLTWGGTYSGGKDIMHFDLREGDGAAIDKARNHHKANR
jgi:hypothetical protein